MSKLPSLFIFFLLISSVKAQTFMRVAHRGAPAHAPENTLTSFRKAIELKSNFLELDIHQSQDGELVVIHDSTVNRTTNGTGEIKNLTFKELRSLDAGSWFSDAFKGEQIPTLKEVLELMIQHPNVQAILELKDGNDLYPGIEVKVLKIIQELKLDKRIIVKSFDPVLLERLQKLPPYLPALYVFVWGVDWPPLTINKRLTFNSPFKVSVQYLQPQYYLLSKAFIQEAHKHKYKVVVWGVESEDQMKKVIKMGADGIETDHLDLLDKVIGTTSLEK